MGKQSRKKELSSSGAPSSKWTHTRVTRAAETIANPSLKKRHADELVILRQAAEQKQPNALMALGMLYRGGNSAVSEDEKDIDRKELITKAFCYFSLVPLAILQHTFYSREEADSRIAMANGAMGFMLSLQYETDSAHRQSAVEVLKQALILSNEHKADGSSKEWPTDDLLAAMLSLQGFEAQANMRIKEARAFYKECQDLQPEDKRIQVSVAIARRQASRIKNYIHHDDDQDARKAMDDALVQKLCEIKSRCPPDYDDSGVLFLDPDSQWTVPVGPMGDCNYYAESEFEEARQALVDDNDGFEVKFNQKTVCHEELPSWIHKMRVQRTCAMCKSTQQKTMQCSACKKTRYCSKKCQKGHWKTHKNECSTLC